MNRNINHRHIATTLIVFFTLIWPMKGWSQVSSDMSLSNILRRIHSTQTPQELYRTLGSPSAIILPEQASNTGMEVMDDEVVLKFKRNVSIRRSNWGCDVWAYLDKGGTRLRKLQFTMAYDREYGVMLADLEVELGRPVSELRVRQPGSADEKSLAPCLDPEGDVRILLYEGGTYVWVSQETDLAWVVEAYMDLKETPVFLPCESETREQGIKRRSEVPRSLLKKGAKS